MTHQNRYAEIADWIRAIGRWKSRQRKVKDLMLGIESLLREREEMMEEALLKHTNAGESEQYRKADKTLSKTLAMAQKEHRQVLETLAELYQRLEQSQAEDLFDRPSSFIESIQVEDGVDEASRESFPASDPPAFNPGHA